MGSVFFYLNSLVLCSHLSGIHDVISNLAGLSDVIFKLTLLPIVMFYSPRLSGGIF